MLEFVQITAQYSNAVLLAVLPYVSDFSQKLDLPILHPVTTNMVRIFKCDNRKGKTGGLVVLTNGYQFTFLDGRICVYRSPWSYFSLQDPTLVPKFYGRIKLDQKKALEIARETIKKLGYTDKTFYADRPPEVTMPEEIDGKYIPRYRFKWLDPNWNRSGDSDGSVIPILFDVEIDASNGRIQMLSISGTNTTRAGPKIDLQPPPAENAFAKNNHPVEDGGRKTLPVTGAYSNDFLNAILPQLSDFARQTGLAIAIPLTTNEVDMPRYFCALLDAQPYAQIYLKNGDRFNYRHGHVCAFYAHDAYRKFPYDGNPQDFMGKVNISTNEAITVCEQMIRKFGYSGSLPTAQVETRRDNGAKEFTRRIFHWWRTSDGDSEIVSLEMDMETKTIKGFYCDDSSLWRDPPKIDGPFKNN